jgi:tripartite-type tricarboxylate transporter receptor subunit TctC
VAARIMAERMRPLLGQPVIIENVGAAGGSIAVESVARADDAANPFRKMFNVPASAQRRVSQNPTETCDRVLVPALLRL